jgi:hypothetical protein
MLRLLLVLLFTIWANIAPADPIFPPGMRIGIEPPPGLSISQRFPGFADAEKKVAISFLELPMAVFDQVEKSIFGPVPDGVTGVKREMFPFHDGIGILVASKVTVGDAVMYKWFLLAHEFGGANSDFTAFITVEVPEAARAVYTDKVIRDALASVTFRPSPLAEQIGMLPFKLDDMAGFRPLQAMAGGGLIITDGSGSDITKQPYMIVSVGQGAPASPEDRGNMARNILSSAPLSDVVVTSTESMRITGSPGFEIRATAKDLRGDPVKLVQWVRFGASGFLRVVGVGRPEDWDKLFERFRAVRDGIEFR